MDRRAHLASFYALLNELAARTGAPNLLRLPPLRPWPKRGVYFFFEPYETRLESGEGLRVVRVGTHALTEGARSTLTSRLAQHRGAKKTGSGNHRGSIFRLLVGAALAAKQPAIAVATWGRGSSAPAAVRSSEAGLERSVSAWLGQMPVLILEIADEPGQKSQRGFIERNAIALLSNHGKAPLDPPSQTWLGRDCPRDRVRNSGLWNQNHVEEAYVPGFLTVMKALVGKSEHTR